MVRIPGLVQVAALAALATGCMIGPNHRLAEMRMQSHWTAAESPAVIEGSAEEPAAWWDHFQDPVLSGLVREALSTNLEVEAAGLRIVQARSARSRARWLLAPFTTLNAGYKRIYFSENVRPELEIVPGNVGTVVGNLGAAVAPLVPPGTRAPQIEPPRLEVANDLEIYSVGAAAVWEPDIWGATRRRIRGKSALVDASVAQYDNISVLVAAETATTYIQLRTLDERIRELSRNIEHLAVLAQAPGAGEAHEASRALAQSLLEDAQSRLVDLRTARRQYENALCVLLGIQPGMLGDRLGGTGAIPLPPPEIAIGLPSDLLRRRPDVREAERLAAAQCERIGIVKSRMYPSFRLLGGIGLASSSSGDLFSSSSTTAMYGVNVGWNILLYPFIQERVRIEDARYQEALVHFEATVIKAAAEAENALVAYVNALEKTAILAESARNAEAAAQTRAEAARTDPAAFDSAFIALEHRLGQSDKLIAAQGAQSLNMVRLYAAVGGGWEVQEGAALVRDDAREAMRERTNWRTFGGRQRIEQVR